MSSLANEYWRLYNRNTHVLYVMHKVYMKTILGEPVQSSDPSFMRVTTRLSKEFDYIQKLQKGERSHFKGNSITFSSRELTRTFIRPAERLKPYLDHENLAVGSLNPK